MCLQNNVATCSHITTCAGTKLSTASDVMVVGGKNW